MKPSNHIDPLNAVRCQHCGETFDLAAYPDGSPMARALTFQSLCHDCLSEHRAVPCVFCGRGTDLYGSVCDQCAPGFDEEDGASVATADPEELPTMNAPAFPDVRCAACGDIFNHDCSLYVRGGARTLSICSPHCALRIAVDLMEAAMPPRPQPLDYDRLSELRDHYESLSDLDR